MPENQVLARGLLKTDGSRDRIDNIFSRKDGRRKIETVNFVFCPIQGRTPKPERKKGGKRRLPDKSAEYNPAKLSRKPAGFSGFRIFQSMGEKADKNRLNS